MIINLNKGFIFNVDDKEADFMQKDTIQTLITAFTLQGRFCVLATKSTSFSSFIQERKESP